MGNKAEALRQARTCYDHLAGRLGVALTTALLSLGALEDDDPSAGRTWVLTGTGRTLLADFGVDCTPSRTRPLVRGCLDWTERRPHLAGALGSRLLARCDELHWIERHPGFRAVTLTDAGSRGLRSALGLELADPGGPRS